MKNRQAILFMSYAYLTYNEIKYIVDNFENLDDLIENPDIILTEKKITNSINSKLKNALAKNSFSAYCDYMKNNAISYLTIYDDEYPRSLREINDSPKLLYYKGDNILNDKSLAIVGSRKCTDYGKYVTEKFTREIAENGLTTVSGLAYGVDKIVHEVSLESGKKTIAVLGCGIDVIYPLKHKNLYKRIVDSGSIIISEYRIGTEPLPYNFPFRNRIISGLSSGVLIVEAKEKSGTLITANYALDQSKEVYCIPGNINSIYSMGTNGLIKDGAKLVSKASDILEDIFGLDYNKKNEENLKELIATSKEEELVYKLLSAEELSTDQLANKLNLQVSQILSTITLMEMKGILTEINGKWTLI